MGRRRFERFEYAGRTLLAAFSGMTSGPQFVLVHGIGVASRYFRRLEAALAREGGVHTVELPGHGSAPEPREAMSIEDFAELIGAYVRSRGVDEPVLVGHSMGAQIVTAMALQDPVRIRRVVLLSAVVDPRERTALAQGLRLLQDTLVETPHVNWIELTDYLRCGPRWYLKTLPAMLDYRLDEALPHLAADALILRGGRDPICRDDWAERMTRLAPRARLVVVPRKGHVVMHTATEDVAREILTHARDGVQSGQRTGA